MVNFLRWWLLPLHHQIFIFIHFQCKHSNLLLKSPPWENQQHLSRSIMLSKKLRNWWTLYRRLCRHASIVQARYVKNSLNLNFIGSHRLIETKIFKMELLVITYIGNITETEFAKEKYLKQLYSYSFWLKSYNLHHKIKFILNSYLRVFSPRWKWKRLLNSHWVMASGISKLPVLNIRAPIFN